MPSELATANVLPSSDQTTSLATPYPNRASCAKSSAVEGEMTGEISVGEGVGAGVALMVAAGL